MSSAKSPIGGVLAIELQMKSEAAAALKAAGQALERQILQLQQLEVELRTLSGSARDIKLKEYDEAFKQAEYRKWCLLVQREAMGLCHHDEVERHYPIPPKLK